MHRIAKRLLRPGLCGLCWTLTAIGTMMAGNPAGLASDESPGSVAEPLRIFGPAMGSHYSVVIDSPGSANAERLRQECDALFDRINRQMSNWSEDSEISRFNRSRSTEWFPIGKDFLAVTTEAARLHALSSGALEPTLAPLIDAWGFGASKIARLPPDEEIAAALRTIGMSHLEIRPDPPAIRKTIPELQLNMSSLAPGYAADQLQVILDEHGLASHVVDVGGENLAGVARAEGQGWRLGVESPLGGLHKVLEVTQMAIATSGDYRNFHVIKGRAYAHILDPRTGKPVVNPPASVSVMHRSCMTADGLATAMMVLGSQRGMELAEQLGLDVMFLEITPAGELRETSRGQFHDAAGN